MWCGYETIQAEHPETAFEEELLKQGEILLFYCLHGKIMHLDILLINLIQT